MYLVAPAAATILLFLVAQRFPDSRTRWAWRLLGLFTLLTLIGDSTWSVYEIGLDREVPYPSLCDLAYLTAYPFAFAGLLLFPRAPAGALRRLKLTLDTLIGMVAFATLSSYFIIAELLTSSSDQSLLADAVNVTYPLADLGLIFAVLVLIARPGPRYLNLPLALLAAGFAATAVTDSLFIYAADVSGYATGDLLDIGGMVSYNLTAYAALATFGTPQPAGQDTSTQGRTSSPSRSLVPYAAATLLAILMVGSQLADRPEQFRYLVTAGSTLALILIVARQVLSIYENASLNRALGARADELARRHQQLQLLHRATFALSQRLHTRDVLALARLLISEWAGTKHVDIWQLDGRRPCLWSETGDGRGRQRQHPPLSLRADRVKLAATLLPSYSATARGRNRPRRRPVP